MIARAPAASAQPNDDEGLAVLNAGASGYCHTHAPTATLAAANRGRARLEARHG